MVRERITLSVVLPSYKEAENLENILPKIVSCLKKIDVLYEIIVVDTMKKTDNTEEICAKNGVRYVKREDGNDYGNAIRTGIHESEGEYTVFMDADGSHNPFDIEKLYNEIITTNCDLVIGSRYCKGGKTDNSFTLVAMSRFLNIVYRVLFNMKVNDISNSFRIYKTEQLRKIELECNDFDIVEEILIKLNKTSKEYSIKEIPICFDKRDKGESKRQLLRFIFSYIKTISKLMRINDGND